jgi:L-aspartate oxidase
LLEGLVFGARAAEDIAEELGRKGPVRLEVPPVRARHVDLMQTGLDLDDLIKSLRALMWRQMGITRDAAGIAEAAEQVDRWSHYILPLEFHDPPGWVMQNMLLVARLMIDAASRRQESRGTHFRRDFPQPDPAMNHHITLAATTLDGRLIDAAKTQGS